MRIGGMSGIFLKVLLSFDTANRHRARPKIFTSFVGANGPVQELICSSSGTWLDLGIRRYVADEIMLKR